MIQEVFERKKCDFRMGTKIKSDFVLDTRVTRSLNQHILSHCNWREINAQNTERLVLREMKCPNTCSTHRARQYLSSLKIREGRLASSRRKTESDLHMNGINAENSKLIMKRVLSPMYNSRLTFYFIHDQYDFDLFIYVVQSVLQTWGCSLCNV